MDFTPTSIPDVLLIKPAVHEDARGFFMETYKDTAFAEAGVKETFIQDNLTGSRRGVLRGLHYQLRHPQGKLIQAMAGEIFDVCVDLRRSSPTFKRWVGARLSGENKHLLWIPTGFAHGYYVLSEWAQVHYKVTDVYAPEWERTLLWSDPEVGIEWPIPEGEMPILSTKDDKGLSLREADLYE